jgi:hypothetical protein
MSEVTFEVVQGITGIDFLNTGKNHEHFSRPLYHGTRKRALEASEEERKRTSQAARHILSFVRDHWQEYFSNDSLADFQSHNRDLTYFCDPSILVFGQLSNFSYGDFYLTTSLGNAAAFAKTRGGELLEMAYDNARGLQRLAIPIEDNSLQADLALVLKEAALYEASPKVILVFEKVAFVDLLDEKGDELPLDPDFLDDLLDFLYLENGHCSVAYNYRLKKDHKPYLAKLLQGPTLEEAFQRVYGCDSEAYDKKYR